MICREVEVLRLLKERVLKKNTLKATEICDKNGLPNGVFWKIEGNIKKWLVGPRPSLWSKIVRSFFILVEHLMGVLGRVGVVQNDPKISDILDRRPPKNWT